MNDVLKQMYDNFKKQFGHYPSCPSLRTPQSACTCAERK